MSSYEILSQDEVKKLHQNFKDKLLSMLIRQLPKKIRGNRIDEVVVLDAGCDLVITAMRYGDELRPKEFGELMNEGPEALRRRKAEIETLGSPFTPYQQLRIDNAAATRKESPEVSAVFGEQDRIYLRIKDTMPSPLENLVMAKLEEKGYRLLDYKAGYATDAAGKQKFRIGKLLADDPDMMRLFSQDPFRVTEPIIVLSRNADDIARMSADRGWDSCMSPDAPEAKFTDHVPEDIRQGAVIAYLITPDDPHIHDPLARIMIKPYREIHDGGELFDPDFANDHPLRAGFLKAIGKVASFPLLPFLKPRARIFMAGNPYGIGTPGFEKSLRDFIEDNFNRNKAGKFEMSPGLYLDEQPLRIERKEGVISPLYERRAPESIF